MIKKKQKKLFNFIIEKKENEKVKTNITEEFKKFLVENDIELKSYYSDICYVDVSDKIGFIRTLPYSKYLKILENNFKYIDDKKDYFIDFYLKYDEYKELIDKNINLMRVGKWLRTNIQDELSSSEIEKIVIKYKEYQKKLKN